MNAANNTTEIAEDLANVEAELATAIAEGDAASIADLTPEIVTLKAMVAIEAGEILADEAGGPANEGIHSGGVYLA